jgi:hypothetical protein
MATRYWLLKAKSRIQYQVASCEMWTKWYPNRFFSEFLQFSTGAYYSAIAHTQQPPPSESCYNRKLVSHSWWLISVPALVRSQSTGFFLLRFLWTSVVRRESLQMFAVLNRKSTSLHAAYYELSVSKTYKKLSLVTYVCIYIYIYIYIYICMCRLQWPHGMNRLRPLEHWDREFESLSRYGCLCAFILYLCYSLCR